MYVVLAGFVLGLVLNGWRVYSHLWALRWRYNLVRKNVELRGTHEGLLLTARPAFRVIDVVSTLGFLFGGLLVMAGGFGPSWLVGGVVSLLLAFQWTTVHTEFVVNAPRSMFSAGTKVLPWQRGATGDGTFDRSVVLERAGLEELALLDADMRRRLLERLPHVTVHQGTVTSDWIGAALVGTVERDATRAVQLALAMQEVGDPVPRLVEIARTDPERGVRAHAMAALLRGAGERPETIALAAELRGEDVGWALARGGAAAIAMLDWLREHGAQGDLAEIRLHSDAPELSESCDRAIAGIVGRGGAAVAGRVSPVLDRRGALSPRGAKTKG